MGTGRQKAQRPIPKATESGCAQWLGGVEWIRYSEIWPLHIRPMGVSTTPGGGHGKRAKGVLQYQASILIRTIRIIRRMTDNRKKYPAQKPATD